MLALFLQDAWKVLLYSLVLGAGIPVVYALGVRSLAVVPGGRRGGPAGDGTTRAHPVAVGLAGLCFAVVLAGVALGLLYVVAAGQGKMLSFEHVYPTIVAKS